MTSYVQGFLIFQMLILPLILIVQPRQRAIFAFMIIWFIFPNEATNIVGVYGYPLFFILEILLSLTLWAIILTNNTDHTDHTDHKSALNFKNEKKILQILSLCFIIQYTVGVLVVDIWFNISNENLIPQRLQGIVNGFAAITFFYACYKFINTIGHLITVFKVFVFLSTLLALELLATIVVNPLSEAMSGKTIKEFGGFYSIFLNDPHSVSIFSAVGSLSALYLWKTFNKSWFAFAGLASTYPLFYNFSGRAIVCAFFCGLLYLIIMNVSPLKRKTLIYLMGIALVCVISFFPLIVEFIYSYTPSFIDHGAFNPASARRLMNIASTDSVLIRAGMQLRGLEVIADTMPFGVGQRGISFYLEDSSKVIDQGLSNNQIILGYNLVTSGIKVTELHNSYLDIVASYGLLGLISLFMMLKGLVMNWSNYLRKFSHYDVINIGSIVYALLLMLGFFYTFYSSPKIYVIFFILFHMTFLLSSDPRFFSMTNNKGINKN